MKVGIYNEPSGGGVGGAESTVAILAEALSATNQVEIVHHRSALCLEDLRGVSGTRLERVGLRYVAPEPYSFGLSHLPWRRYRDARDWRASGGTPYECARLYQPSGRTHIASASSTTDIHANA